MSGRAGGNACISQFASHEVPGISYSSAASLHHPISGVTLPHTAKLDTAKLVKVLAKYLVSFTTCGVACKSGLLRAVIVLVSEDEA
jgi:hypothetical protein